MSEDWEKKELMAQSTFYTNELIKAQMEQMEIQKEIFLLEMERSNQRLKIEAFKIWKKIEDL